MEACKIYPPLQPYLIANYLPNIIFGFFESLSASLVIPGVVSYLGWRTT